MLTTEQIIKNKQNFKNLCKENIKRKGTEQLLDYLDVTDFFEAPCSTKFHLNYKGGLCEHSLNVYTELIALCTLHNVDITQNIETLTIVSLFHDICKANFYKQVMKPVKVNGMWKDQLVYEIDDKLPLGHGEKSVIILQKYLSLSVEEMLAIRWHMGAFDCAFKGGEYAFGTAQDKSLLVTLLQVADLLATQVLESTHSEI